MTEANDPADASNSSDATSAALATIAPSSRLSAARRADDLNALGAQPQVDLLVIGGGVTGTGVALDAAHRGLSVVLVEKHDLAFGTSRWSSKLVHGGLRYLASGSVGIAYESAVERDALIRTIAPHLTHPLAQVVPLHDSVTTRDTALTRIGFLAGDVLRRLARTPAHELGRSRRISREEVIAMAPTVRRDGLRGGLLNWDGQLTDDARLTIGIARTAAAHGATILTYCSASNVTGTSATITDELTATTFDIGARAVINATGVWAGTLDPSVSVRPSRGTHLVFSGEIFGGLTAGLTVPVPNTFGRYVFALPQPDGRVYVGLTDEEAPGPVPDVAEASDDEIAFLLETVSAALHTPLRREDIVSTFSGLRPLIDSGAGRTADVSRRHAVLTGGDGLITVVGGKLTTYRRMAEQAVDAAVASAGILSRESGTRTLPLLGAAPRERLRRIDAPRRLVEKYGTEAEAVVALTDTDPELAQSVAEGTDITGAAPTDPPW